MYGSETWTVNKTIQKRLDGYGFQHLVKSRAYKSTIIWRVTIIIITGCLQKNAYSKTFERHKEEASKWVPRQPLQGKRKRGRRDVSYIDRLKEDVGLENINELTKQLCWIEKDGENVQ